MFENLFNFFSDFDPKLKTLFARLTIATAITLSGSLSYYYFNPLAHFTIFEGFLLGFAPTLLVGGGIITAFFYHERKKNLLDYWSRTIDKVSDLYVDVEEKQESILEFEVVEPEIAQEPLFSDSLEMPRTEKRREENLVEFQPKSILIPIGKIGSSTSESNTKQVQFTNPIANVMNIQALPKKEQPVFFLTQHETQRANTGKGQTQTNFQKNDQTDVLAEGTTHNRVKFDQ